MADVPEEAAGSPARKKLCVALAENADAAISTEENNPVVIGSCVSEKALKRSGLLSGIGSTSGLASLPSHISPDDVKLWETACNCGGAASIPTNELVTLIQVADAIGDPNDKEWVDELGNRVRKADWAVPRQRDSILSCLLRLRPDQLLRIIQASGHNGYKDADRFMRDLELFPTALHNALISAFFEDFEEFEVHSEDAFKMFSLLASVSIPGYSMESISIHPSNDPSPMPAVTGSVMGATLSKHPSVISISLSHEAQHPYLLRNFRLALQPGSLACLKDLTLSINAHPCGCMELASLLGCVPSLECIELKICIFSPPAPSESPTGQHVSLSHFSLAASPAKLPRLENLEIEELCPEQEEVHEARAPGEPNEDTRQSCAHLFLSFIDAPVLTHLQITFCRSVMSVRALLSALDASRFPSVTELQLFCMPEGVSEANRDYRAGVSMSSQLGGFGLPAGAHVQLSGEHPTSLATAAGHVCDASALSVTSLSIALEGSDSPPTTGTWQCFRCVHAIERVVEKVQKCTGLRELDLDCLCAVSDRRGPQFTSLLSSALKHLSQLTSLTLGTRFCDSVLRGDSHVLLAGNSFAEALLALKELRCMRVQGGGLRPELRFDAVQPFFEACSKLPLVSELRLCFYGVTVVAVRELLPKMKSLKTLSLKGGTLDASGSAYVPLKSEFPAVAIHISPLHGWEF